MPLIEEDGSEDMVCGCGLTANAHNHLAATWTESIELIEPLGISLEVHVEVSRRGLKRHWSLVRDILKLDSIAEHDVSLGVGLLAADTVGQFALKVDELDRNARLSRELKQSQKECKKLEKELKRKDKALAEAAALLVLSKKANAIWGDPEDGQ